MIPCGFPQGGSLFCGNITGNSEKKDIIRMNTKVYFCKCSQDLSLNGRQIHEQLCKSADQLPPSSILSCFRADIDRKDIVTSSTLFMNLHHSVLSPPHLERLVNAEIARTDTISLKTTTFKIASDVVVISREKDKLDDFINTYGGVLEIKPLLLKNLVLPELYTGEIESISGGFGNYKIRIKMPDLIDYDRCTYCGLCIYRCPEGCISHSMEINLSDCSYCGKCEQFCPYKAVDLHKYSETELIASQVLIIDDDLKVELPSDQRGIHRLNKIKEFFSNIGEYHVAELIQHNPSICQYHSGFDSGCKRCLEACPTDAIRKNEEGLYIDHFRCEDCGRCVSVCPTGAMQYVPIDDGFFIEYIKAVKPAGYTLVIASEDDLRSFHFKSIGKRFEGVIFLEHPNPDALNSMQLLALYASGVKGVYIKGKNRDALNREQEFVNRIIKDLSGVESFLKVFDLDMDGFRQVNNPVSEPVSLKFTGRRDTFFALLASLMNQSGIPAVRVEDYLQRFSDIQCNSEHCSLCLACVNVCSTGAMKANQEDFSLRFSPSACINCGLCIELCPEKVLKAEVIEQIDDGFFNERLLAQDEPMYCKRCGRLFGNRKVYDEVKRRLMEAGLFQERGKFLHLCENCRVIAMFEEPMKEQ